MTALHHVGNTHTAENEQFDPHEYVLGLILNALASGTNVEISAKDGESKITLQANTNEAAMLVSNEYEFFTEKINFFRVKALDDNLVLDHSHGLIKNIDELTWTAAYHASQGRLMRGCNKTDVLFLKYWPNLTSVPKTNDDISMCALFSRHPTSMHVAKKMLDVSQQDLNRFFSSARASGLSAISNKSLGESASLPNSGVKRPLFKRILDKLSLI